MNENNTPMATGISEITGKVVRVRHATEADMVFLREKIETHRLDSEHLHYSQFVVAFEDGDLIGFGRLTKVGDACHIGCIVIIEEKRGMRLGDMIAEHLIHLIDEAPVEALYVPAEYAGCFKRLGFSEVPGAAVELFGAADTACAEGGKEDRVVMVSKGYESVR